MNVYILVSKDNKSFKIGKADDVSRRILRIGKDRFDDEKQWYIHFDTEKEAYTLERKLHTLYDFCAFPLQEEFDGCFEFFDIKALNSVLFYLDIHNDLYGKLFNVSDGLHRKSVCKIRSERIKKMQTKLRENGKQIGGWQISPEKRLKGQKANHDKAIAFAQSMLTIIIPLSDSGLTHQKIADELNNLGIKTYLGSQWGRISVLRVLKYREELDNTDKLI